MTVGLSKLVKISYTAKHNGELIDNNNNRPLLFEFGAGEVIIGLEKALYDKKAGDKLNVTVAPHDAYGIYSDQNIHKLPKEQFIGVDIKVDMDIFVQNKSGETSQAKIIKIDNEGVTIDLNHPLAGKTIDFEIEILSVK